MPDFKQYLPKSLLSSPLLEQALTHRSLRPRDANYERLEFLGDAVIGFVVADWLYRKRPGSSEGTLSRLRASIIRRDTLAVIADRFGISGAIRAATKDVLNSPAVREDAVEALVGACYLAAGFRAARALVLRLLNEPLQNAASTQAFKDPKTALQEWTQKRGLPLPSYAHRILPGSKHRPVFSATCEISALRTVTNGTGTTKRAAEQAAARSAIQLLAPDTPLRADPILPNSAKSPQTENP